MCFDGKHIAIDEDRAITLKLGWRDPETGTEEVTSTVRLGLWPYGITSRVDARFRLIGEASKELDAAMDAAEFYFHGEGEAERDGLVDEYNRSTSPAHA